MKEDLCIPIYLNEKIVFDLLAIMEDGFSKVSELTTLQCKEKSIAGEAGSEINNKGIISNLFGLTLSGKLSSNYSNQGKAEQKQEKVHTNVSLFSKLRKTLIMDEIIKSDKHNVTYINNLHPGDFIEIEGNVKKSPMVDTLKTFIEVFDTFKNFISNPQQGNKNINKKQKNVDQIILEQIKMIYDDLIKTNTLDLLVDVNNEKFKVLLSAQIKYFIDGFESEVVEGNYRILGKVIKIYREDEHINLFRKTSFKIFQKPIIDNMINDFNKCLGNNETENESQIKFPKIISEVKGPCLVIIPIAIYV